MDFLHLWNVDILFVKVDILFDKVDILFEVDPLQAYLLVGSRHPFVLNDQKWIFLKKLI